jgi:Tfp pilus assembly protein PilE
MKSRGFTVIELIIAAVVLMAIGLLFVAQKNDIDARNRDSARKTAVNAIYYNLEYIFFPTNQYYPQILAAKDLKGLDPANLKDPHGTEIGQTGSTIRYEPHQCDQGKCQSFTLRADLENEADFIKNDPR